MEEPGRGSGFNCALNLMVQMEVSGVIFFLSPCLHLPKFHSYSHFPFFPLAPPPPSPHSQFLLHFPCLSLPWPRRLFPVWAPARFLQGEECTGLAEPQLTFCLCCAHTYAGCLMMAYSWKANICTEKLSPSDHREDREDNWKELAALLNFLFFIYF